MKKGADVMASIRDSINSTLKSLGQNSSDLQNQIDTYLASIAPVITDAVAAGDELTLRYTRDQVAAHLGRVSLGYLNRQQTLITNAVMGALTAAIKVGIGAALA